MEPLVSVVIPMYNREKTIKRAIDSILNQTYQNIEIIVVDDGSTDDSVQIVESHYYDAVRLIKLPNNVGASAARNAGMEVAKGDYIAFQDSDDEWLSDKLKIQIDYMLCEGYKVCFCPYTLFMDENTTQLVPTPETLKKLDEEGIISVLRRQNVVGTPTLVVAREVIEQVGFFDEELSHSEDYVYVIRIIQMYKIGYVKQSLVNAYRQKNCVTLNLDGSYKTIEFLLENYSDFFEPEDLLFRSKPLNNVKYNEEFSIETKKLRELYAKGDRIKEDHFNDVMIKLLGEKYIMAKEIEEIEKYYRSLRTLQLRSKKFAIYGAGEIGTSIYYHLKRRDLLPQFFIVSKYQRNTPKYIGNIPIKEISEVSDKNMEIIVAVSLGLQKEILTNLYKLNFNNYYILDDMYHVNVIDLNHDV